MNMKSVLLMSAVLTGLLVTVTAASAQAPGSAVPMGSNPANALNVTQGSSTPLTMQQRPRLREQALKHRDAEIRMQDDVGVGTVLPQDARLIEIPAEFGIERYQLALANQKTLLVDPATRRVVEVID